MAWLIFILVLLHHLIWLYIILRKDREVKKPQQTKSPSPPQMPLKKFCVKVYTSHK